MRRHKRARLRLNYAQSHQWLGRTHLVWDWSLYSQRCHSLAVGLLEGRKVSVVNLVRLVPSALNADDELDRFRLDRGEPACSFKA